MPTRVKYDRLPPGTHTWVFTEKLVMLKECPVHGDFDPRETATCPVLDRDAPPFKACGRAGKSVERLHIAGQVNVGHNDIIEVEDLNDPRSERARIVRGHLEGFGTPGQHGYQGPVARIIEEKERKAPAPKPER